MSLCAAALDYGAPISRWMSTRDSSPEQIWIPRPRDVTDKKTTGVPHNPAWAGTTANEWSSSADTIAPEAPSNVRMQ
jgi:hypothetical protein